ncbi:YggT family protein [Stackebrandtia soli]|uniref:YggT family protein n=1 Tax=Stackebrandtia soli TaxID=1892856 RepID=UPI0039E7C64D
MVIQIAYLVVFVFYMFLLARLVAGAVVRFSRHWRPGHNTAVALEVVFSVTDPPLKGLRRILPPLRLGNVAFDLAFVALFLIVIVLRMYLAMLL